MSKYIVDTDDFEPMFKVDSIGVFGIGKSVIDSTEDHSWLRVKSLEGFEELNSDYINEHFGSLQDEAYHRGLEEGKKATYGLVADASNAEYQRGLDDAWEAAKKIFGYEIDGGIPIDKIGSVFGYSENATFCTADIIRHNTASEAIEKLKAYEEKQKADDKIKVGDEVDWSGDKFIVTRIFQPYNKAEECDGVDMDGCTYHDVFVSGLTKTGRHVDITDMLKGALE